MTSGPRVSFAMTCHSYGRYIGTAIDSILAQRGCEVEVIVVDDASTDETAAVLRGYANDPRVRPIRHETVMGHLPSNNEGLALARGDFVGVFDADDYLLRPDALARKVDLFDRHPRVGLVYSAYALVDENGQPFRLFRPWPSDYVREGREEFAHLVNACYIPHTSTLVRRSFHVRPDAVYDLALTHSGDWDVWLRIAARHDVAYIADSLQAYRQHRSQHSTRGTSPQTATTQLLRTIDKGFAALAPEDARRLEHLREPAITNALLHQSRTDRSLGRTRRAWAGLVDACRRSPRLLIAPQLYWSAARLAALTLLGPAQYARLVGTRDRIAGGKGAVA